MKESCSRKTVIRIMGAYVSWVMGSGFATGQEIFQFFTSYGYKSFALIAIDLAGFMLVGGMLLTACCRHRDEADFSPAGFFCGRYLGAFYEWFIPVSMFGGMVVLISGAGATLNEYYGINHYIGAFLVAAAAFAAYVAGFQRFVRIVSIIGPVIICFTLIVGIVTVIGDFDAMAAAERLHQDSVSISLWAYGGLRGFYICPIILQAARYFIRHSEQVRIMSERRFGERFLEALR